MSTRTRTVTGVLAAASLFAACGGPAESAEEPRGSSVPVAESPAPAPATEPAEPQATVPAPAPSQSAPEPASRRTERSSPVERAPAATPAPPPTEPERAPPALAAGTTLTLVLDQTLSTKSNKPGDPFSAHLLTDFLAPDGEVLLPEGTVVRGVVTEAQESPSSGVPAMLRLRIADVEVGGDALPLLADVEAMQLETEAKDSDRLTAGKVAVGAAAGALLGKALGKGGTKGAVAGAAAGAAVAIVTRDGHATLPQGAQMTIRLVETVVLR